MVSDRSLDRSQRILAWRILHGKLRIGAFLRRTGTRAQHICPHACCSVEICCPSGVCCCTGNPALAPVQAPVRDHTPSLPPRHRCAWLPRSPVMRVPRLRWRPPLLLLVLLLHCLTAGALAWAAGRAAQGAFKPRLSGAPLLRLPGGGAAP